MSLQGYKQLCLCIIVIACIALGYALFMQSTFNVTSFDAAYGHDPRRIYRAIAVFAGVMLLGSAIEYIRSSYQKECVHCKKRISKEATKCSHCGSSV